MWLEGLKPASTYLHSIKDIKYKLFTWYTTSPKLLRLTCELFQIR